MKKTTSFNPEEVKRRLVNLYNAIQNDYSIQRYSLGWKDVQELISKRYKNIPKSDVQFSDGVVTDAIEVLKQGKLLETIQAFGRELSINVQTLHEK